MELNRLLEMKRLWLGVILRTAVYLVGLKIESGDQKEQENG